MSNRRAKNSATQRVRPSTGAGGQARRVLGAVAISPEMTALCVPTTQRGVRDVTSDLGCIVGAVAVAAAASNPVVSISAALYIGCMQRRLSNLLHELSHDKLFPSKRANKAVGSVIASMMMVSFRDYHDDHVVHHGRLGSHVDPKVQNYIARGALSPHNDKFAFVMRVVVPNAIWDLPKETLSTWRRQPGSESERQLRAALWASAIAATAWAGYLPRFLGLWLAPLLFVRPVINMLTDMANHLGIIENDDVLARTRGFALNPIMKHLLAGHHDDAWHPVHHLLTRVQHHRLEEAMGLINRERPDLNGRIPWCSGFVWRRRRTPEIPSVLEHVVETLHDSANATGDRLGAA